MRRMLSLLLALLPLLAVPARAVDVSEREREILQVDTLRDELPADAQQALEDYSPSAVTDPADALFAVMKWAAQLSVSVLPDALRTAAMLLAAAILCAAAGHTGQTGALPVLPMTGALAAAVIFTGGMRSMTSLAQTALDDLDAYAKLLLPVMCGAAAASGAVTGAGAVYMGASLFFSVLTSAVRTVLLPLVYVFIALATIECALPDSGLGGARKLLGWCVSVFLKGIASVFTAYISLTGLLSGSSDEAALSAAKSALSAAIPVVGSIAADASEAVLQSARFLRATAGTFGILAVCALALVPFLRITVCFLTMKLAAAVAEMAAEKAHAALLGHFSAAMGYLLAMVGCAGLMLLLSVCCFMKVAAG